MIKITQEVLINSLILKAKTEYDHGHNNAVISLLKMTISDEPTSEIRINELFRNSFINLGLTNSIVTMHDETFISLCAEVLSLIKEDSKLAAVKAVKDATALGLVDCKNIVYSFDHYLKTAGHIQQ